ncbi:MAG TPA: Spy/CpxP family protein refolding chaperone [Acetobacteraceae bacterium]|nr:Spy/CpxP family protein refolding chaperone [Acetobacteraceae bacterium]
MLSATRTAVTAIILATSMAMAHAQTPDQDHAAHHPAAQGTQPAQPPTGLGRGPMGGPGAGMMGNGAGMMGSGPRMMGGGAGMMGGSWNTTSYLGSLKTELGITQRQGPAWKEYADTVSGIGEQMQGLHQTMFEAMGTASWQERRDMMNHMFQARQQASDTVHDAAARLVAALDPTQQAKARRILPGLAYGPGMMGRRGPAAGRR